MFRLFLLITILLTNSFAKDWICGNKTTTIDDYGNHIVINNKYKAFYDGKCMDSDGGENCKVFKNKAYTYIIVWVDDDYELVVNNKWGKREQCYESVK
jgi:hypothetical protein